MRWKPAASKAASAAALSSTRSTTYPTPISNPGMASIEAALKPADTNYYFYVLNPEAGAHVFASTSAEHNANVAKYSGG